MTDTTTCSRCSQAIDYCDAFGCFPDCICRQTSGECICQEEDAPDVITDVSVTHAKIYYVCGEHIPDLTTLAS